MDETRVQAAMAELNAHLQAALQRCINLATDLAIAQKELADMRQAAEAAQSQTKGESP